MVKLGFAAPCFRPISTSTSKAISLVSSLRIFKLLCGHYYSFPSGVDPVSGLVTQPGAGRRGRPRSQDACLQALALALGKG